MTRRALSSVELIIALVIVALIALSTGGMLTAVARATESDRASRTLLMRSHAAQVRLRAYVDPALCALQHDGQSGSLALWLHDDRDVGQVNLSEIRLIAHDQAESRLVVERVSFPEGWSEQQVEAADVALGAGADYFAAVAQQRALGFTSLQVIASAVQSAAWSFSDETPSEARSGMLALAVGPSAGEPTDLRFVFGLPNHTQPGP